MALGLLVMPNHVEEFKGYRIAIYSLLDHCAVITPPGGNAVMDFGAHRPVATVAEGYTVCLDRAKALVDELTAEPGN
ncbi:hypothetical protein E2F50_01030 [Rhizobium deserti]|uniref:Uncharacterized protein n=1 Tax=Rhizobium deserti TaxID=2547961 RepID=A0A4R5ULQ0_9HYPH|nr:hypothetical protein [Rhizobium deserti]TDK38767.1 hypothetical protein E2F50_01030 [Rhizobium deserti]